MSSKKRIVLDGHGLNIEQICAISSGQVLVEVTESPQVWHDIEASVQLLDEGIRTNQPIYGVTTSFGGLANRVIDGHLVKQLQQNLVKSHRAGVGGFLPPEDVRAIMAVRLNSHLHGASAIRPVLLERMCLFLNEDVVPCIPEHGSIGASGDLIPLAYLAGALLGLDEAYQVDFKGERMSCLTALKQLDLPIISLKGKEGLAMMNGTSASTAIAARLCGEAGELFVLALQCHAFFAQAFGASDQSFHPFIHEKKPHNGQLWVADQMLKLLDGSLLIRQELDGTHEHRGDQPIQDRYHLRCLAQYIGPLIDGYQQISKNIVVELNAATDNPLIDVSQNKSFHGGNFLAQYVGLGMDQLRHYMGLCAKHLDVSISQLMSAEFNGGLPASLVGNGQNPVNVGLKPLQIAGNSIMPMLTFYGNSLVDRFPTHAEQYNQNINSQSMGSCHLTKQALTLMNHYLSISLLVGMQALDLKTYKTKGHYDSRDVLGNGTLPLYEVVVDLLGLDVQQPYLFNDTDRLIDGDLAILFADLTSGQSKLLEQVRETAASLHLSHVPL